MQFFATEERWWIFAKFSLCRPPIHMSFVSLYSWLISAPRELLKSNFDRKKKKNSHLELQTLSSKTRNEKPCIRWLIGSFRRLILVILRVFILIFHHLVLILHFESKMKFNFVLISIFNQNRNTNFLLTSNFDYSANSNPNHLIFDSMESQLSYLS